MVVPTEISDLSEELRRCALAHKRLHVLSHGAGPVDDSVKSQDDGASGVNPPLKLVGQQGRSQACRKSNKSELSYGKTKRYSLILAAASTLESTTLLFLKEELERP